MRFAIAAGILSNILPVASKSRNEEFNGHGRRRRKIQNVLDKENLGESKMALDGSQSVVRKTGHSDFFAQFFDPNGSQLSNDTPPVNPVQCDPRSSDVDVGILSCGFGKYCMESGDYELGGICMDAQVDRDLQAENVIPICNTSSPFYQRYYECDCSEFDLATNLGTVSCIFGYYCFDYLNITCGFATITGTFYDSFNFTEAFCYEFVTPYKQDVCYLYTPYGFTGCTFNGELCNSCEGSYYFSPLYNVTYYCTLFDCTNTCGMHAGNDCFGEYVALIAVPNVTAECFIETFDPTTTDPTEDPTEDPSLPPTTTTITPAPAEPSPSETAAPVEVGTSAPVADNPSPTPAPVKDSTTPGPTDSPVAGPVEAPSNAPGSAGTSIFDQKTAVSSVGLLMGLLVYFVY